MKQRASLFLPVLAFVIACSHLATAQGTDTLMLKPPVSPHIWNSLIITSIQNPALSGLERKHQLYFDYSRPWFNNFDNTYGRNRFHVGYDILIKTFKDKFKLSSGVYFSGLFQSYMTEQSFGLVHSFGIKFKNNSELSIGVSVLALQIKSIDFTNLRTEEQFDGAGFTPLVSNGEIIESDNTTNYGPLNVGVWYKAECYFVGLSALNLTTPKESFLKDGGIKSKMWLYAYAGYHFIIKKKLTITPSLQYQTEQGLFHSFQPRLTFSFSKNRFLIGTYYENDAMHGLIGIDLLHHHLLINFDAGGFINSDVNTGMAGFKVRTRVHF